MIFVVVDNALRSGSSAHEFAVLALPRYSSNAPRSGLSAHEPAVLALPRYSSHQNVIAYREMRQNLATIPHTVPLRPSHRRIDPAVSGPLQVSTHQQSLLRRVGPGRHPYHAVAMVLHRVQHFGIQSESREATTNPVSRVGPPSAAAA